MKVEEEWEKEVDEEMRRQKAMTTKKHLKAMFPGIHVDSDLEEAKEEEEEDEEDMMYTYVIV